MKKFPPLHPETSKALPPRLECDMPSIFLLVRSLYDAEIHLGLGMLIYETAHQILISGDNPSMPTIEEGRSASLFGRVATTAMLCGDASFFEQVIHCSKALRDGNGGDAVGWAAAYLKARLNNDARPPIASAVAAAKNRDTKTAIPAIVARDACRRLGLPLAEGARGKKRKVEKPK